MSTGGRFALAAGEALVLTVDPVGAESLGVQIIDPWVSPTRTARRPAAST